MILKGNPLILEKKKQHDAKYLNQVLKTFREKISI